MSSISTVEPFYIYLFRHGQTDSNRPEVGRIQGQQERLDAQLNETGRDQAQMLALKLSTLFKIDQVYSSPAQRCLDTASAIKAVFNCKVTEEEGLAGINHGDHDGMKFTSRNALHDEFYPLYLEKHPEQANNPLYRWNVNPLKGGESHFEVWTRNYYALTTLAHETIKSGGKALFVSSTTAAISTLIELPNTKHKIVPLFSDPEAMKIGNCDIVQLQFHPGVGLPGKAIQFIRKIALSELGPDSFKPAENNETKNNKENSEK